jgi:DNA-directed RNA polymerase subunit E'/Rpb7
MDIQKVGPYITTELTATVSLHPRQLDNNIYKHLKENLIKKLEGRCYSKYGYISTIYKILDYTEGRILPENPMASATFGVKFSCRLCHPMKKRFIVCKIQKMTKQYINASNGPITVIITMNRLNNNVFYQDAKSNKLYARIDKENNIEITAGKYVKVLIENSTFNDSDKIIMALGQLNGMATDEEIKEHIQEEFGSENDKIIDFEGYINQDDKVQEKPPVGKDPAN